MKLRFFNEGIVGFLEEIIEENHLRALRLSLEQYFRRYERLKTVDISRNVHCFKDSRA